MKGKKFFKLLTALNDGEIKRFHLFVASPYFNQNQSLSTLLEVLIHLLSENDRTLNSDNQIWSAAFPNQAYKEQIYKNHLSALNKLLAEFLGQEQFQAKASLKARMELYGLNQHQQTDLLQRKLNKLINQESVQDASYFFEQYQLNELAFSLQVRNQAWPSQRQLPLVIKDLEIYYYLNKLRFYSVMLNFKNVMSLEIEIELENQFLLEIEKNNFYSSPILQAYYRLFQLLKSGKHAKALLVYLDDYHQKISKGELRQIYTAILNYFSVQIMQGEVQYLELCFSLYKQMIDHEIIYDNGIIYPYQHFRNIIILALRNNDLKFAEAFFRKNKKSIPANQKENVEVYCKAAILFRKAKYEDCLDLLSNFKLEDLYHYPEHKMLLLKCCYALGEVEVLLSTLEAFRVFLLRNKRLPEIQIKAYASFCRMLKKLNDLKFESPSKKAKWLKELEVLEFIHHKEWLLEKYEQL